MTQADRAREHLKQWLASKEGYTYLHHFVRKNADALSFSSILSSVYHQQSRPKDQSGYQREISHDFLIFTLETMLPELHRHPTLVHGVLTGQIRFVLEFIWTRFCWRLKDRARSKSADLRAHLYRRARETMTKSPQIATFRPTKQKFLYCPAEYTTEAAQLPVSTPADSYSDWPAPPGPATDERPEKYLFSTDFLTQAGLFFWQEAAQRLQTRPLVPVRELVRYLATHHPWVNLPRQIDTPPQEDRTPANLEQPEDHVDRLNTLQSITVMAARFIETLNREQCVVLAGTMEDPPRTYREIADQLGLPDHNRPYRIQQKNIRLLKKFCSCWPGPPLAELPEEIGLAFLEEVKIHAKKRLAARNLE
ncbi:hypothetical protein [Desulfolithobacter sp.]